jgi:hypothetical protein
VLHKDAGWSNPRVLASLCVIFLCGAAVGAAITSSVLHARMASSQPTIHAAQRAGVQRLKAELNLTAEQESTVMKVLDDYGKYYQNIEDEREDVADHGKQRILSVLNEQQRKRFLELLKDPTLLPESPLQ